MNVFKEFTKRNLKERKLDGIEEHLQILKGKLIIDRGNGMLADFMDKITTEGSEVELYEVMVALAQILSGIDIVASRFHTSIVQIITLETQRLIAKDNATDETKS